MEMVDGDVCVREYTPEDKPRLVELGNNINVVKRLMDRFPHPFTDRDADNWLELVKGETRLCNFALAWKGEYVGGIGLDPMSDIHSGTTNIGYWLGEPYWGNGIITRAARMVTEYALNELLFIRIQAIVFADNPASMRVLEKNGYAREGVMRKHVRKFGEVKDCVLYAKLRNPE